jgi:hypothetical protein
LLATFARTGVGFETFLGMAAARFFAALTGRETVRGFGFADLIWVALCARALPAGERLVAGFSRVAFGLEPALTAPRAEVRVESFLTFLATGVLMRKLPRYCDSSLINQRKTSWKA